ncbi:hypothetical protein [Streptomyces thioluteus]
MSFENMHASMAGANGAEIAAKGEALVKAEGEIEKIGNALKAHVGRTQWAGEGGDAFREWGDAFAKQVIKLAQVAGATGRHMSRAGAAIKTAADHMPKAPEGSMGMCSADAGKEKARVETMERANGSCPMSRPMDRPPQGPGVRIPLEPPVPSEPVVTETAPGDSPPMCRVLTDLKAR